MSAASEPALTGAPASERRPVALPCLVLAITIAGGLLRFATLGQGVWFDEAGQIREVAGSFHHLWTGVTHQDLTPPLYAVCLWVWRHGFGLDVPALRALSATLGTLTIPVAFLVADRMAGRRAALTVALLAATSPVIVYYSQEIRAYALLVLICSIELLAFVAVWQRPERRWAAVWTLTSALALATHYYAALVVAPQAAALLRLAWRAPQLRRAVGWGVGAIVLEALALGLLLRFQSAHVFHYVIGQIGSTLVHEHYVVGPAGSGSTLGEEFFLGPGGPDKSLSTGLLLAFTLLGVAAVRSGRGAARRGGVELALLTLLPAALAVPAFALLHQSYQGRYLLVVWLPLTALVGTGFSLIAWRPARLAVIGACLAVSLAITVATAAVPRFSGREDVATPARALGTATVDRVVAIDQRWDLLPLRLYRPRARGVTRSPVRVSELDVLAMPDRAFPADADAERPPPPRIADLPPEMTLRRLIRGPTFVIERYASPTPVRLRLLASDGVFGGYWRFLSEPRGGRFVPPS